jgi:outer membrane lipoprotein SlyB
MKTKITLFVLASGLIGSGVGCTFPSRGTVYDRSSAGRSMTVETGDIVAVRDVEISGRNTIVGTGGGAVVGSAAGKGIGKGVGSTIAGAAGAVGGAILGEAIEEVATRKRAQEVTIKLSNGDTVAVVQQVGHDGVFAVGEHVQVMQGGAGTTVRRLY